MKNLFYIISGFIIGALLTYYFCPREIGQGPIKIVKPKGVISIEKAKELNANWTLNRKKAVDSAAQKQGRSEDNRSTYWSLDDIENYLAYAKAESDNLGYDMTGIRIYLGVYGKNAGQAKKDLTTMFIVPTGKQRKSKANSFNFLSVLNKDLQIPPLNDGGAGHPPGSGYPQ